jgi:hypothetical protein
MINAMNKRSISRKIGFLLLPYGLLILMLWTTNPERLAAVWLLVPFVLLFWGLWVTAYHGLHALGLKGQKRFNRRLVLSFCLALLPTLLLVLQSINQLTVRDALLLVIFMVMLMLYLSRTNFSRR